MVAGNVANTRFNFQGSGLGTPAATSFYGLQLAGGSLVTGTGENAYFEETTGAQMRSDVYAVERHGAGNPEFLARVKGASGLLYGVLGTDTPTGAGDPYSHVLTHADTLPYITWWSHLGGLEFDEVSDTKISQLVISGETGQPLRLSVTVEGIRPRHQAAEETTATVEVGDAPVFYDGDGALMLEGAAVASIGSFTCTINRNVTRIMGDGLLPIDLAEGLFSVEWSVGKLYTAISMRKRLMYGAGAPSNDTEVVETVLQLGATGIDMKFTQSTGPERSIQIECPNVTVSPYEVPPNTDGSPLREEIPMIALDDGVDEPITVTILNDIADLTP